MNPTAAAALRWGGAVVGLLLVVWLTVPAMINAMANSIQFGDEDETSVLLEGGGEDAADEAGAAGDAEPADNGEPADGEDEPAEEEAADEDGGDGNGDGNGEGNGDGDGGADENGDGTATTTGGQYEIQPGDTLFSIAEQVLGDGHRWPEIAELNGLEDGRDLRVGQELQLPDS